MRYWMKDKRTTLGLLAASLFAALVLVACAGGYASYSYATTPPPPLRVETYGPAPGAGYIWIQGYWGYSGNNYVWMPGRWERPPSGRRQWQSGYWENRANRYRWHAGHWR